MSDYPKFKAEDYPTLFIEETDKKLGEKLNQNMRYAFKTIARGGKSLIQSCKDMYLNRVVAHKSLLPEFANDPIEQMRLLREARISAMLQHPNTLPTYEAMKLVQGYSLREVLNYRERYDLRQMVDIIIQVAHALEYAHMHGVVHRDLKPDNILIGPFGEILLMDWGLAKVWSKSGEVSPYEEVPPKRGSKEQTMTGYQKLQGSIFYMSPEQIERDPDIGRLSDIYSLGVMLYEILTGQLPSKGDTVDKALRSTKEDIPTPPSEISKTPIPCTLEETVMACLEKKPSKRIQSASELIRLLQENWSIS